MSENLSVDLHSGTLARRLLCAHPEGAGVGGCAEPGFAPCLLAERLGQEFFEVLDASAEAEGALKTSPWFHRTARRADGCCLRPSRTSQSQDR